MKKRLKRVGTLLMVVGIGLVAYSLAISGTLFSPASVIGAFSFLLGALLYDPDAYLPALWP